MFDPVDPKQSLPDLEEGILQYWKEEDTFKRSIRQRQKGSADPWDKAESQSFMPPWRSKQQKSTPYSFYDGPPFATGLPHYGHLLAGTVKDVIPRYQTMRGKEVQRRFGWDCHGLPIENLIEKEHDISDKQQIEEMGIAAFNDLCRGSVQRYTTEWRQAVERMGRWVDMDWDYKTMDPEFMESIWWVFATLHEKGLIYEGRKSMHVCPRCVTPLSNFEVTLGYQDTTDWSTMTTYPLIDTDLTLIAWTTTTWTLPGNLFLAIGPDIEYVRVRLEQAQTEYVVAATLADTVFKERDYEVIGTIAPEELAGKHYEPLFPYFTELYKKQDAFRVVLGDFVTTDEGTGVVHIAPGFGTDDYEVGKREGVDVLSHVSMDGTMLDAVTDFAGCAVKPIDDPSKTDKAIATKLKEMGRLFSEGPIKHSYPHCWRCDSPLINYATASWFVGVESIKEKLLLSNQKTHWVPEHVRDGRFGKWLENARDWAISRNRYWGSPLPIWRTDDGNDLTVIGSRDALMAEQTIRFTKISVTRHAESEGNLIPLYQGELPGTNLTKQGTKQARTLGDYFKTQNLSVIYCSPLARTIQTAEIIANKTGAQVVIDDRLREVSFGEWEGKTVDFSDLTFLKARRQHKIEKNKPESIYHFDGMESWESVQERIDAFLEETLKKHRSDHILIVTHADPAINIKRFFTQDDPVKLSHQPYPEKAVPVTYFWDHNTEQQLDLHAETVDTITWPGSAHDTSVELTLVRHGETDWNKEGRAQGHTDTHLNEHGTHQAKTLAEHLKGNHYDCIITSDLARAVETAEILSQELMVPIEGRWEELRERCVGDWQGQTKADILKEHPCRAEAGLHTNFHYLTPPKGESLSTLFTRVSKALDRLREEYAGKKVLIVSHGGTTKSILALMHNLTYAEALAKQPDNTATTTVSLHPAVKRIPDVLDCWFESGSMPYAQEHYPFEFRHWKNDVPPGFPANFIAENLDQTRGWFYTLMVLSTTLFEKPAFQHCICGGIILAEDGKKMSKRLQNYPDPLEVMQTYGADALRFSLMSSPVVRAETLRFSEKGVAESMQKVILPLWNTYSFFVTYANAANFDPVESRRHSVHPLDTWIRAEVQDLVNRMTSELDEYDLSATCSELHETIDALTNWYVRLSRRRFAGKGIMDAYPDTSGDAEQQDQHDALMTLYDVLLTVSQLLAPFCPFVTEAIYLNLVAEDHGSIHLTDWPLQRVLSPEEEMLMTKHRTLRLIVSLGNSIRGTATIKIRQPLLKATIAIPPRLAERLDLTAADIDLLRQELNVKEVLFADNPEELADTIVNVDARKVGPRLGGRVQDIIRAGKEGEFTIQDDGRIMILDEVLSPEEAEVVYRGKEGGNVAADKGVVVSLDTTVTEDLEREGEARDLIRAIQRIRKESGLSFTDHITVQIKGADDVIEAHGDLIAQETRASFSDNGGQEHTVDIGERTVTLQFEKVS